MTYDDPLDATRQQLRQEPHNVLALCDGGLDRVLGFVRLTTVLEKLLEGGTIDLPALAEKPLFVPETTSLMRLLEQFKRTHLPAALVVDEFGDVAGLVSLTDVITSIVGDLPAEPGEEPMIVRRNDGSWLFDGGLDLDAALRTLDAPPLGDEERQHYHTLGGLAMLALGRVPRTGDVFERGGHRFAIVDMDGHRVDRVLVSRLDRPAKTPPRQESGPGPGLINSRTLVSSLRLLPISSPALSTAGLRMRHSPVDTGSLLVPNTRRDASDSRHHHQWIRI